MREVLFRKLGIGVARDHTRKNDEMRENSGFF